MAIKQKPKWAAAYHKRAIAYQALGDYAAAESYYDEALTLQRSVFPALHENTGELHMRRGALFRMLGDHERARTSRRRESTASKANR